MAFNIRHSIQLLIAATIASFACGGRILNAQELTMPARWHKPLEYVNPLFRQDTLTICILGDIMMHQGQISASKEKDGSYDFSSYFQFLEDDIRNADISIANMEFTLAGEPYTGYPCFSAPDCFATYLAGCGFDIFLAANNHIFDKGTKGAERTIGIYRELQRTHGIRFTGISGNADELHDNNPLFIRSKGISLALINITYGTNMSLPTVWPKTNYIGEKTKLANAFSKAEEEDADYIIAFPHWGTEYVLKHSEAQKKEAVWLAENGADWIIGSHPHVVQDSMEINDVPVLFSLGNAVSNMSAKNTQMGLMATIRIVRKGNGDLEALPVQIKYLWCSRPGGYNDSYTVIPVTGFISRRDGWKDPADYDRMLAAYQRITKETDINE